MPGNPFQRRNKAATIAASLMCVLAVLAFIIGGIATYVSYIPYKDLPDQVREQVETMIKQSGAKVAPETLLEDYYRRMGITVLAVGAILILLAIPVAMRKRAGTIAAVALVALLLALSVMMALGTLAGGAAASSGCFLIVVIVPLGILLYWLFAALRDTRSSNQGGNYGDQYQYMQALQQWYSQNAAGGYPTQPPPPAPGGLPPPPPPPSAPPENRPPHDPSANP